LKRVLTVLNHWMKCQNIRLIIIIVIVFFSSFFYCFSVKDSILFPHCISNMRSNLLPVHIYYYCKALIDVYCMWYSRIVNRTNTWIDFCRFQYNGELCNRSFTIKFPQQTIRFSFAPTHLNVQVYRGEGGGRWQYYDKQFPTVLELGKKVFHG